MITVKREGIILGKTDLAFENEGVMNPAVIAEGETVHLFYRAVREGNYSTIGYCRLNGPLQVVQRDKEPLLYPQADYESQGVEDPRIVKIGDTYYMTYTAYDGVSAVGALAVSNDLKHFEKKGIITSQFTYAQFEELVQTKGHQGDKYFRPYNNRESYTSSGKKVYLTDKNVVFFPRKINGKFCFLHRIKPDIQLVNVDKLEDLTYDFWINYFLDFTQHIIFEPRHDHESSYIGGGCPPIELPEGWLMIYHSVRDTTDGYVYSASAALLDLENPAIEIARLPYPLFTPKTEYELTGIVNQVCFPTGTALFGDRLYIYYGAADNCIACASVSVKELVKELMSFQ
ncbi:MAG: 4-mannooligosaccharide phosphorylase [Candidatus Ordinivivax streblomastigis]|uniref:4-mannooligosaccharide phosphorylase n=1 Tax=Candidatus Ordinivivax streblomastigis TaxID=2540710 RepID=A0A5M8P5W4_9BACT|nr:MAG: 4-mannooligosaccharide phosphorylase [Candidatus Ordinivivax streblomastigis]